MAIHKETYMEFVMSTFGDIRSAVNSKVYDELDSLITSYKDDMPFADMLRYVGPKNIARVPDILAWYLNDEYIGIGRAITYQRPPGYQRSRGCGGEHGELVLTIAHRDTFKIGEYEQSLQVAFYPVRKRRLEKIWIPWAIENGYHTRATDALYEMLELNLNSSKMSSDQYSAERRKIVQGYFVVGGIPDIQRVAINSVLWRSPHLAYNQDCERDHLEEELMMYIELIRMALK